MAINFFSKNVESCIAGSDWTKLEKLLSTQDTGVPWKTQFFGIHKHTLLHLAIRKNNESLAVFLLEKGVDLEVLDWQHRTPVFEAALNGHKTMMQLLLKHKAKLDVVDKDGRTIMHHAVWNGQASILPMILQHGGSKLLNQKAGSYAVYCKSLGETLQVSGLTPLHEAVLCCSLKMVQELIKLGSNIDSVDNGGQKPLTLFNKYRVKMNLSDNTLKEFEDTLTSELKESKTNNDKTSDTMKNGKDLLQGAASPTLWNQGGDQKILVERQPQRSVTKERIPTAKDINRDSFLSVKEAVGSLTLSVDHSMKELENRYATIIKELQSSNANSNQANGHLQALQNLMTQMQSTVMEKTQEVEKGMTILIKQNEELHGSFCQHDHMNEYVYYKIFHLVSNHVGFKPGIWKQLCQELLQGYPQHFIDGNISDTDKTHTNDRDKAYECLVRWKVYTARYADKLEPLKRVLTKLGLDTTFKDIDEIVASHVQKSTACQEGSLTDRSLNELASKMGSEWQTLALNLDFSLARIQQLKMDHPHSTQDCVTAMLIEWRDREDGFPDIKLARLAEALIRSNKLSLAKQLKL